MSELRKKDEKGLFLIHQCVDTNVFEKIVEQETTKEGWDTLKKLYSGDKMLKKMKLKSLRKQYENLQMKDDKTIVEFFSKMVALTNQMKSCGEKTSKLKKLEKVLKAHPVKFDHIVVAIEESKDLSEMKLE